MPWLFFCGRNCILFLVCALLGLRRAPILLPRAQALLPLLKTPPAELESALLSRAMKCPFTAEATLLRRQGATARPGGGGQLTTALRAGGGVPPRLPTFTPLLPALLSRSTLIRRGLVQEFAYRRHVPPVALSHLPWSACSALCSSPCLLGFLVCLHRLLPAATKHPACWCSHQPRLHQHPLLVA